MAKGTGKKRLILWAFIPLALIIVILAVLLSRPLDLTPWSGRIEGYVNSKVNGEVRLHGIRVKVLPSPEVELTGVEAYYSGEAFLKASRLKARVSLAPLAYGKTAFETIEAEDLDLTLRRYAKGRLNLSEFLKVAKAEKKEEEGPEVEVKRKADEEERTFSLGLLDIENGRVAFIDMVPSRKAAFEAVGIDAEIRSNGNGHGYLAYGTLLPSTPFAFSGVIKGGDLEGIGNVFDLDLSIFNPYVKSPGASVAALVDLDLAYRFNDKDTLKARVDYEGLEAAYPSTFPRTLKSPAGSALAEFSFNKGYFDLDIQDIVIRFADFDLKGSFALTGPKAERQMEIRASTTPVAFAEFLAYLPTGKMGKAAARVKAIEPLGGDITIDELTLSGRLKEYKGGRIFRRPGGADIKATLDGVSFRYKGLDRPFSDISGEVAFSDGALDIKGLGARFGKDTLEGLTGRVRDLLGSAAFDMNASATLDARESLETARALVQGKASERLSKTEAQGTVYLKAGLKGELRGKAPLRYSGEARVAGGSLYYGGLPVGLDSIDGSLSFDNERIVVEEAALTTDGSAMAFKGSVEGYMAEGPFVRVDAEGSLSGETLERLAKKGDDLAADGSMPFRVSARGRKGDFTASASIDATAASLAYGDYIDKTNGFPLVLEAEGGLRGREIRVRKAEASFGSSSLAASGSYGLDSKGYALSLATEQMLISDLDEVSGYLNRQYPSSGVVSFSFKALRPSVAAHPAYEGSVAVRNGMFETRALPHPIEVANASAVFEGDRAKVSLERLTTGSTALDARLDVASISGRSVSFELDFASLDTKDLTARKKEEDEEDGENGEDEEEREKGKRPIVGTGSLKAAKGLLWGHPFDSLTASVIMDPRGVHLHPVNMTLDYGLARGSVSYYTAKDEPLRFTTDLALTDVDLETLLASLGTKRRILSGKLRANLLLSMNRGSEPALKGLNGQASVVTERGRLWKFGFLSDIFSIVNIISIDELFREGLLYKEMNGNFTVRDGVLTTTDLFFESDSLRMSAVGDIDLPENTIDATLAIHPFVTIDKIVSQIPLAGWIITGEEESTVSLYFGLDGPVKDPDVMPLPVKSIKENVFGILERILKAPLKLFD